MRQEELELRHCRAIVALADAGSITQAAKQLGVAQSTLSETISSLGRLLGTPVTEKLSGRYATLTAAGSTLLPHAREMLKVADDAVTSVTSVFRETRATIAVGSVESVTSYLLPAAFEKMRRARPRLEFQVTTGLCASLLLEVQRGTLDVAFLLSGNLGRQNSIPLCRSRISFVVKPTDTFRTRRPSRSELASRVLLLSDTEGTFYEVLREWFAQADMPLPKIQSVGSVDGVKKAIATSQTGAIGVLPLFTIHEELQRQELVDLRLATESPQLQVEAIVRAESRAQKAVTELIDLLREQ